MEVPAEYTSFDDDNKSDDQVIQEADTALSQIEGSIKLLQQAAAKQRARVKGRGILLVNFNAVRRVKKLEGEEREQTLAQLRRAFSALLPGQQSDMGFAEAAD